MLAMIAKLLPLIGLIVSLNAVYTHRQVKRTPGYRSWCDFNSAASCSKAISSRHGEAVLPVRIDPAMKAGEVFATFHTTHVFLNRVTGVGRDTVVDTPEYKVTAVKLEKVTSRGNPAL